MLENGSVLDRLDEMYIGLRYSVEVTTGGDTVVDEVIVRVIVLVIFVVTYQRWDELAVP